MTTVGMISLGCAKNQVDAEHMLALLSGEGFRLSDDPGEWDAVVVNTCGFIEDAKRESIGAVLQAAAGKGKGRLRRVIVTGCLAERYREELAREIPEADAVLGLGSNARIADAVRRALSGERVLSFGDREALPEEGRRILGNPPYYAYVKVAEGCDNRCSYCAIPMIRGRFRSRPVEAVVGECRRLAAGGVTEINLIAQDTTRYGEDLYGESRLPLLIREIAGVEAVRWIRVLYCHPDRVTDELIETVASEPKAVHYFDIPVQHGSPSVLRAMNRGGSKESILALCGRIRKRIPDVSIRTTLLAGFPTETERDFEILCSLVEEARFDRLGCFAYSEEEGTPAFAMDQLPREVRERRAETVMELQRAVAAECSGRLTGETLEVLVEGRSEDGRYFGRSYRDAPDVDTLVRFSAEKAYGPGDYARVRIVGASGYDLSGTGVPDGPEGGRAT